MSNHTLSNIKNKTQTNRSRRPCNTTQTKPTASATARDSKNTMPPNRRTPQRKTNPTTRNTALFKKNRRALLEGQQSCHWCGQRTATTADHLIEEDRWPQNTPGLNDMDNLVAACKPCNSSRGAKYRNIKHSQKNTAHTKNETININSDRNKIPFL